MFRLFMVLAIAGLGSIALALADEAPPTVHRIDIANFTFAPPRIEVRQGDTIEFTNRDFAPHTATRDGGGWNTGDLKNGASGRVIATDAGTYAYHCAYHPQMKATITVLPASPSPR